MRRVCLHASNQTQNTVINDCSEASVHGAKALQAVDIHFHRL